MNWVDLVIIGLIIYFLVMGYFQGFFRGAIELVGLIFSLLLAFRLYPSVAEIASTRFGLPLSISKIVSFTCTWFVIYLIYYFASSYGHKKIPDNIKESKYNKFGGGAPALIKGLIMTTILLMLVMVLPIPTWARDNISNSKIGGNLLKHSTDVESVLEKEFGGAVSDTLTFLTVKPEGDETTNLGFKVTKLSVDTASENRMLEMVNEERTSRGLKALVMDKKLQEVARAHSKDMFENGYFSHNSLDGKTPFDRMHDAGITFFVAGENLALAPNVDIAHNGLMNSPGHRANILTADFGRVGIGVMDGGSYGKMFSQEFTD